MISLGLWIATKVFRKRVVTEQQAKKIGLFVLIPLLAVAAVLLFILGKHLYDKGLKDQFQDSRNATVAVEARKADEKADAALLNRAEVAEEENDRLENAVVEAKQADPEKGTREVGRVQQSYFDTLPERKR